MLFKTSDPVALFSAVLFYLYTLLSAVPDDLLKAIFAFEVAEPFS